MKSRVKTPAARRLRHAVLLLALTATAAAGQDLPMIDAVPGPRFGPAPGDGPMLPSDVAIGAAGRVYVVDGARHRVARFDADGARLGYFGAEGGGDSELQGPVGIGIAPGGTVYVADRGNDRIQVFDPDGTFRRTLVVSAEATAVTPVDVAVSADGHTLFITANDSHRVVVAAARDGAFEFAWGGFGSDPGAFRYPATVALGGTGDVLVADVLNQRVQVFDPSGTTKRSIGELGAKPGSFLRPKGVTTDRDGRIFVSDSYLGVIQLFAPTGAFIGVLAVAGEPRRFEAPTGLAWAAGRLYVTDMLAGAVFSFDVGATP